jgi:hypothetical protein
MNQTIQLCPKCGAMQANVPACAVCGARLPGFEDAARPRSPIDGGTAMGIALYVLALLGGIVAATALLLWLVFAQL